MCFFLSLNDLKFHLIAFLFDDGKDNVVICSSSCAITLSTKTTQQNQTSYTFDKLGRATI